MVFIKKSEKICSFLKSFNENFKDDSESSKESKSPYIKLAMLESHISNWNTKFPENPSFLHEIINFEDIVYTLEHRDYERDLEFNVKFRLSFNIQKKLDP